MEEWGDMYGHTYKKINAATLTKKLKNLDSTAMNANPCGGTYRKESSHTVQGSLCEDHLHQQECWETPKRNSQELT